MKEYQKKPKVKIEESELNPVSRARAYGVVTREGFLAHFNNWFGHVLYVAMYVWAYLVLAIYIAFLLIMLNNIGVAIAYVSTLLFIYFKMLKFYRKRLKFWRKLKKRCKKSGYRLTVYRGFFKSLKYTDKGCDFSVDTGKEVYCVRLLTVKHYNSRVMFTDKNHAQILYPRPRSGANVVVNNRQGKGFNYIRTHEARGFGIMSVKQIDINYGEQMSALAYKTVHKVLLVNPTPHDIYKRMREGGMSPTGTGEDMGDYTLYTAHDFLDNLLARKTSIYQNQTNINH